MIGLWRIVPIGGLVLSSAAMAADVATTFDVGDDFAASGNRVFVAEDNGGVIEMHLVSEPHRAPYRIGSGYDEGGDRIAADGDLLFVAEDNGGRVEYFNLRTGGYWQVLLERSDFDVGDGLAAGQGLLYVAEDNGGLVRTYEIATGLPGRWFETSYDSGDRVAAAGPLFLVAEDNGGTIEVYNALQDWSVPRAVPSGFDRDDGLGAYILGIDGLQLVICVAEDNGGHVRCDAHDMGQFLY